MEDSIEQLEQSIVLTPDANNETYFDPTDVNGTSSINYERLRLLNRGTWLDRREENKEVTHRRDNMSVLNSISGQVELTDFQKQKARRLFERLDLREIGKSVEIVAFAVCAVVANDDVHHGSRYHPRMVNPDREFAHIADRLEFTETQLHSIIATVIDRR